MIDNEFTRSGSSGMARDPTAPEWATLPVQAVSPKTSPTRWLWLVSDAARYVTGVTLPVDAGYVNKR